MPPSSRLTAFLAAAALTWLLTLWLGGFGPLVAGILAGRFAPRRGGFLYPALGAATAWLLWFLATALTAPLLPLARLLGGIVGIGAALGPALPVLASLLGGVAAGVGALCGREIFAALHPAPRGSSIAP